MKRLFVVAVLLLSASLVSGQELTLYSMPSPREINWNSPQGLALSSLGNRFTFQHLDHKHAIGHVFIELTDGKELILTGSVPTKDNTSNRKVLKEGYGLGILFTGIEGRLEDTADLQAELPDRYKTGRIGFIRFLLNPQTYQRLKDYLAEYKARGYGSIYNGLNRPREGLGAGCSAFGVSFLEVAGLLHPVWAKEWPVEVRIPTEVIGGPLTGNKVPLTKVLLLRRWAEPKEPHMVLKLYEPYRIWSWINRTWDAEKANPTHKVGLLQRGKAKGLVYDCRHLPCPTEPALLVPPPAPQPAGKGGTDPHQGN